MKVRKIPLRLCLGCNEMKPKQELMRVVKNQAGEVRLDLTGKLPGRGAYVCRQKACLEKAFKSKRLNRNLQTNIQESVFQAMQEEIHE